MATEYRDERLVKELEAEIERNNCGVDDCLWIVCCGVFAAICVLPKYNKRQTAQSKLMIELAKPIRPKGQSNTPPPPSYEKPLPSASGN
jgi:hypothetical protein